MDNTPLHVLFEKYTFGGESMGHLEDGRAIFCPFVIPQEIALVQPVIEKKRYLRAALVKVENQAEERILPICKHFGECGGCQYQHLSYPQQLLVKEGLVVETLQRIAGLENPPVTSIVKSDEPYYYRNSINFQVTAKGEVGFYYYHKSEVLPIDECHLPATALLNLWKQIDLEPIPGLKHIHFRQGVEGEMMVILESDDPQELPEMELDLPVSVVHQSPAGMIVMAGDDYLVFEVLKRPFRVSAASFFQVNEYQAGRMVEKVLSLLSGSSGSLLELYSGVGLFTAFCAHQFKEVVAIEESPSACEDFVVNLDEFDHVSLYVGRVEDILPGLEQQFDVALVDPPRSGLDNITIYELCENHPQKIIYVSCDVATLARDIKKLMAHGYELVEVTPFDMFPQTYHIETISLFQWNDPKPS